MSNPRYQRSAFCSRDRLRWRVWVADDSYGIKVYLQSDTSGDPILETPICIDRANERLDSPPKEAVCEIGAILTVTDRDARDLYLDQIRRKLTRYGMHERMPSGWPLRRRLLLKTFNALIPIRSVGARSVSTSATWAWTGPRKPRR